MELKNASTQELIRELKTRGFVTDLLIGIEDVKRNIEEINGEKSDDEPEIVMTHDEMVGVLKSMSNDIEIHALEVDTLIFTTIIETQESKTR
jgi:hypothetical protein